MAGGKTTNEIHLRVRDKYGNIVGYVKIYTEDGEVKVGYAPHKNSEYHLTYRVSGMYLRQAYSFDLGIEIDGHVYYDGDKAICISNATYDGCHWPDGNYHVGFIRYDAERMAWGISGDVDGSIDDLFSEMSGEIIVIDTGSAGNYAPKEVKLL